MKAFFLLAFVSINAFAWGPTGHRVVGEVAMKKLSPKAMEQVFKLLKGQTLARVANWPDEIKSEPTTWSHTYAWHYTDWPDQMAQHDETNSSGKLIGSINEQVKILKDIKLTDAERAQALKFLVHFIGDLHMPLHVGNGLDQGGNFCKVTFQGKSMNLHSVWDEGMIDFTRLSYIEMASFVSQGRTKAQVEAWTKGSILDWALESKNLRSQIYPNNVNAPTEPMSTRSYCRGDAPVPEADQPKLSYEYSYKWVPVVEERLFQAGLRLAVLLNQNL